MPTAGTPPPETHGQTSAWLQIAEAIRALILGGGLAVDQQMPGEAQEKRRAGRRRP